MGTEYSNSKLRQYHFGSVDFGTGSDVTQVIPLPLRGRDDSQGTPVSMRGRVKGYSVFNVTEDFAGSTTDAGVTVGDGTTANKYFEDNLPLDEDLDATEAIYVLDNGDAVDIPGGNEGTPGTLTITFVSATGTPTGIADVVVDIEWFDI